MKQKCLISLIGLGVLSALLYYGLYHSNDFILEAAQKVREGEKAYFLLPIAIAFVFSYVHGEFTGRFWHALGLQAKK
jgi:hypothetical protein